MTSRRDFTRNLYGSGRLWRWFVHQGWVYRHFEPYESFASVLNKRNDQAPARPEHRTPIKPSLRRRHQ